MSSLERLIAEMNKQNPGQVRRCTDAYESIPRIPFGNAKLEWLLRGGFPLNRQIELFGPESSGKSLIAYRILRQWQRMPENSERKAVLIDYECTHDDAWATKQGVNMNNLFVWTPGEEDTAERAFDAVKKFAETGEVGFIIFDSIGALTTKSRKQSKSYEDKSMGGSAAVVTDFVNDFNPIRSKNKITFVVINQLRDDIGNPYSLGNSPGGRALKHHDSVRLYVSACEYFDYKGESCSQYNNPAGHHIQCIVAKNKISPPDRKRITITFNYVEGIDDFSDNVDMSISLGLVRGSGAWFEIIDFDTGELIAKKNGKKQLKEYLTENKEYYNKLVEVLMERVKE